MIRTVLGDIEAGQLGPADYHEHVFQVSPLLPGDELDDPGRSAAELTDLRDSGFAAVIDATPIGLGRKPAELARVSASTGVRVVASTGAHRDAHYAPGHWLQDLTVSQLSRLFVSEIGTGMLGSDERGTSGPGAAAARTDDSRPPRAGIVKTAVDYWRITAFERRVLEAAAMAHHQTGAPVMVHLEAGSAAFEVLDLLRAEGMDSSAVVLAHIDRNPDPGLHADLARCGAYLGYDGFARSRSGPDSALIDCLTRAVEGGALGRVLLGGDVARSSRYVAYGGMPGLRYVGQRVVPRLLAAGHRTLVDHAIRLNPARLLDRFSADPAAASPPAEPWSLRVPSSIQRGRAR